MPIKRSLIIRLILTALVLGIGIGAVWESDFAYWLIGGFGAFALVLSAVARSKIIYLAGVLTLVFCLGAVWARMSDPIIDQSHIGFYNGQKISLQGIIVEEPEMKEASVKYVMGKIMANNIDLRGRLLVTARFYPKYRYGDLLDIECKLKKPEPFGGFEYDKYLSRYGIYSICSFPKIALLEQNKGTDVRIMLLDFKKFY